MLNDHEFEVAYATGYHEPGDFFIDSLMNSQSFDFGLGYFRSTGFKSLAIGFATFLQNGGTMRFIINDSLTEKDKTSILTGQDTVSDESYEQALLEDIKLLTRTLTKRDQHFFDCLSWLIASDRLQIIAVKPRNNKVGIVHHKFGIFKDGAGNKVVFNGSVNFSQFAIEKNVETLWCECSWLATGIYEKRIAEMENLLEAIWNDESPAVRTIPIEHVKTQIAHLFPKKNIKELVEQECKLAEELIEEYNALGADPSKVKEALEKLRKSLGSASVIMKSNKWEHQDKAVTEFLQAERGVLNMATGTGKTHTALRICQELIAKGEIETIIITCDGTDLLNQWYKEILRLFSKKPGWLILRQYELYHESEKFRNRPTKKILISSRLQLDLGMVRLDEHQGRKTLLIHDEVHKLGSHGNQQKLNGLSDAIRFRLGLSATPEREYDKEGTQFILDHIGPIIFNYRLEDAIEKGILSPFNYFPVPYELTVGDRGRLKDVHKRKAARAATSNPMPDEEFWNELARVYKTAEGKIPAFRDFINNNPHLLERCIVFTETKEFGELILDIIHGHHTDFHTYYSGEDSLMLSRFANGEIECLLTCHRLSEGIDIHSLRNVILLSSSRTKLETIQRIGRCLRIDPEDSNKIANVIDLVRVNDKEDSEMNADEERQIFLSNLALIRPKSYSYVR